MQTKAKTKQNNFIKPIINKYATMQTKAKQNKTKQFAANQ